MKIWAKKSFYIHRGDRKVFTELPLEERPPNYLYFEKNLYYDVAQNGDTYIISDYIKQMPVPTEYIDAYFEREGERTTRLREEKLNTIL
jgi:hypothetical protein